MRAILLIGGLGTRLYPLTLSKPKALLPVLDRPFLSYQLDLLKAGNVREVMLACSERNRAWKKDFERLAPRGLKMRFAFESQPLGTGGAIRFAFDHFRSRNDSSPVLVFNGDVFFDLRVEKFLAFHIKRNASCTIALTRVKDPSRFGLVKTSTSGRVEQFLEKSKRKTSVRTVNAGAYLMAPEVIRRIPTGRAVSVERETFPMLLKEKAAVYGFPMKGYWNDIGTHESYLQAQTDLLTTKNFWTQDLLLRKRAALK